MEAWEPAEKDLVESGRVELVSRSERVPYLPNNVEYNTETEIIVTTWRKCEIIN